MLFGMARLKLKHSIKKSTIVASKSGARDRGRARKRARESDDGGSIFLPDKLQLVRMIAMKGATDDEIADTFGVSREMFSKWRAAYPSFEKALDQGRLSVDADVVVSLYKETQGYHYTEKVAAGKDGDIVEVERFARPDTSAIKYWLKCRKPEEWSERTIISGGRGSDGKELPIGLKVESRNEVIEAIVGMIATKPDGKNKPPEEPTEDRKRPS